MLLLLYPLIISAYGVVPISPSPSPLPEFAVASVKRSPPSSGVSFGVDFKPTKLRVTGTLAGLLSVAYEIEESRIYGGNSWVKEEVFDVEGITENPASIAEMKSMLAKLLQQRFRLRIREAIKDTRIYFLEVNGKGPKAAPQDGGGSSAGRGWLKGDWSMDRLAQHLSRELGVAVLDRTGLNGLYEVNLDWDGGGLKFSDNSSGSPSLLTALREQSGLKLRAARGPVKTIMVEEAYEPLPN